MTEVPHDNNYKAMFDKRLIHGVVTMEQIGRPLAYFSLRNVFLDCRGELKIHPSSEWGWFAMAITMSHTVLSGQVTDGQQITGAARRTVIVDECAWICSRALLYNCHIQHHAIVACGAVVRNVVVPPYTIVEGNPAMAVRHYVDGHWVPVPENERVLPKYVRQQ